jgi:hypothetical protein
MAGYSETLACTYHTMKSHIPEYRNFPLKNPRSADANRNNSFIPVRSFLVLTIPLYRSTTTRDPRPAPCNQAAHDIRQTGLIDLIPFLLLFYLLHADSWRNFKLLTLTGVLPVCGRSPAGIADSNPARDMVDISATG